MRLLPLEIGRVNTQMRVIDGTDGTIEFPVLAWLIEHRDGLVLFDAGMHRDLQASFDRIGEGTASRFTPNFDAGEEVAARLEASGVRPADVTHLVLSHLHFDHVGGCCEVPEARLVVQRDEWQAGHDAALIDLGVYNPDDYDLGHQVHEVTGEHDLFGDGRIVCIPTPGHTVGHQSLRVELESGPVVLTGDCVYTESMLETMSVPRFTRDERARAQQLDSMRRLRDLQTAGCRLLYGHDRAQVDALPTAGLR